MIVTITPPAAEPITVDEVMAHCRLDAANLEAGYADAIGLLISAARIQAEQELRRYLARWVEYGTSAHQIKAKKGSALVIGGQPVMVVDHPGAKPQPFMRPALDNNAQDSLLAAGEYIKKRLATKHGLDTSEISIEAEE